LIRKSGVLDLRNLLDYLVKMENIKSIIELPGKGKALIVTDIHGNLSDFEKYMEIWENFKDKNNHLILTGDCIHTLSGGKDNSIKILESVVRHYEQEENFHVLLGNHEFSHVSGEDVHKSGINQTKRFKMYLELKFFSNWKHKLNFYINFFKKLPLAAKTKNGVFISHAAPVKNINDINDIINITDDGYVPHNEKLYQILWNRYPGDYNEDDIDVFLEKVGCKFSVVGHTPVDGYKVIGNQVVLSSSFGLGKKCYLELDLEKEISGVKDLVGMIKYL